jgi:BirA family biotin operon repressor/biotin-[acetyl-CoA-carboxylase] ligase
LESTSHFIGKPYLQFTELDSTNTFLQHWAAEENLPEGAAVSTLFQHQGRGQRGTSWLSRAGENILTSILLYPQFLKPDEQFWLSKTIALGVKDFIQYLLPGENIKIKWPNDIYVNGEKIAGILIENTLQGNQLKNSIIGIGININGLDESLVRATSLQKITGRIYGINHLLPMLYMQIEKNYLLLKNGHKNTIEAFYSQSIYGLGDVLSFMDNISQTSFTGIITGTTPGGALCVQTETGLRTYYLKEITLL